MNKIWIGVWSMQKKSIKKRVPKSLHVSTIVEENKSARSFIGLTLVLRHKDYILLLDWSITTIRQSYQFTHNVTREDFLMWHFINPGLRGHCMFSLRFNLL